MTAKDKILAKLAEMPDWIESMGLAAQLDGLTPRCVQSVLSRQALYGIIDRKLMLGQRNKRFLYRTKS